MPSAKSPARRVSTYKIVQAILGILFAGYLLWRLYVVFIGSPAYGPDTWARFLIAGVVLGSVYALIAIGYTLVYGILRMINFAHGDIMMIGAFGGYFVFEAFKAIPAPTLADPKMTFLDANPILSVVAAFVVGASVAALGGYFLEKIAYRPLRGAPTIGAFDFRHRSIDIPGKCRAATLWHPATGLFQPGYSHTRKWLESRHWGNNRHPALYGCIDSGRLSFAHARPILTGDADPLGSLHAGGCRKQAGCILDGH